MLKYEETYDGWLRPNLYCDRCNNVEDTLYESEEGEELCWCCITGTLKTISVDDFEYKKEV